MRNSLLRDSLVSGATKNGVCEFEVQTGFDDGELTQRQLVSQEGSTMIKRAHFDRWLSIQLKCQKLIHQHLLKHFT